jgi:RNA polymerase sigma-70 factor (ECF subfamily)
MPARVARYVLGVDGDDLAPLVELAAQGDDRALRQLVLATEGAVHRLCAYLGSRHDAEDLMQETYLRAVASLPHYRAEASVRAWLFGIARHVCADYVRRRQRRSRIERKLAASTNLTVSGSSVEVRDLIESLDPERRDAFVLTQVLGLSYEAAAQVCGCPVGTIRSRVARARTQLVAAVRQADAI